MRSIAFRLIIAFCCIVTLLVCQGIFAYYSARDLAEAQRNVLKKELELRNIHKGLSEARLTVYKLLGTMNPYQMDALRDEFDRKISQLKAQFNKYGISTDLLIRNKRTYDEIIRYHYDFSVKLARSLIDNKSETQHDGLNDFLKNEIAKIENKSRAHVRTAHRKAVFFTVGICFLALLVSFVWAFLLANSLTDRRRAEAVLRKSEEKYRHFYNNAQVGICRSVMAGGRIVDCNSTLAKMFGYGSPEQCASEFITEEHYVDPKQRQRLTDMLQKNGEINNFEVQLTRRDGTPLWTIISAHLYPKENLIESVVVDITARKQSEEDLRRLSAAVAQADEVIVITDRDGTIEFVNPAFERITGYAAHEAVGDNPRMLKSGKQDDLFYRKLWETISRGDVWRGHFVNRKKDGGFYDEDAAITPIKNNDGVITNYVAVKRDVSRELKTEAQLRQSQKMESIGTLAGGIAHDFNNILGAIMGYTELGLDDLKDRPEQCRWLQQVLEASHRAKDLVGQILTFSRSTAVARAPMKTIPIIKEACKFLRSSLPATIEIKQDIRTSRDLIMGDPTQFHQVLMNLCTNAGHAMQETGGELTVVLETVTLDKEDEMTCPDLKPGAYLKLTVRDTGCGIDRENLEHIFDPYFTTKEQGEGTGLGLAVVHGIVKDGGGDIRVYSEPGKGTTFQLLFPQIEKLEMPVQRNKRDVLPTGTETILLVDDEETLVITMTKLLERLGYTVVSEMNPVKALEKFEQSGKAYDLVMTDKTMPGMTGYELAGKIRQIRPDIPILLCTGFEEKDIMEKMQKTGIKGYIMKPVNRRDLAVAVRRLLNSGDA